jgi:hypothetical protein
MRSARTLKTGDSRRQRVLEWKLAETLQASRQYDPRELGYWEDEEYYFPEEDGDDSYNWYEWSICSKTYCRGDLTLVTTLCPGTGQPYIHVSLAAKGADDYLGMKNVGFGPVRYLVSSFKEYLSTLREKGIEYPIWFEPYDEDSFGEYRREIYRKLGFEPCILFPEMVILWP